MAKGCKKKRVSFKAHGKVVSFQRKCSSPAALKAKRKTGHLRVYKTALKQASKPCGKQHGYFNKKYGKCIRDAVRDAESMHASRRG
jgi:hypothetical protein